MKKIFSMVLAVIMVVGLVPAVGVTAAGYAIPADSIIQDPAFYEAVIIDHLPGKNLGDTIAAGDVAGITTLDVSDRGIKNLAGIEYFTELTWLFCNNNQLSELDVSKNVALSSLWCNDNQLTELDVSKNIALTSFACGNNQLSELDVSKNTILLTLVCNSNQLTELDLSKNALWELHCNNNQLTELDVSKNTALSSFNCYNNQLSELDVSKNTALSSLWCSDNQLTELDVSKNTALLDLNCDNNQLIALDLSKNITLAWLRCNNNQLSELDVSKNIALTSLFCGNNQLPELDVGKNTALFSLWCSNNQLTVLDVSKNTALLYIGCNNNQLSELDVSKNATLEELICNSNQLTALDVSNNAALWILDCADNQLTALNVSNNVALGSLLCGNNQLTELDVSKHIALTSLFCNNNKLTALDVSENTVLWHLGCNENQLSELVVSKNIDLTWLDCNDNQLTELDVSKNTALLHLSCNNNKLTELDVSKNTALSQLWCHNNQLSELDVSKNAVLEILWCSDNKLTNLDLSSNPKLKILYCVGNLLTELDVTGLPLTYLNVLYNDMPDESAVKGFTGTWTVEVDRDFNNGGFYFYPQRGSNGNYPHGNFPYDVSVIPDDRMGVMGEWYITGTYRERDNEWVEVQGDIPANILQNMVRIEITMPMNPNGFYVTLGGHGDWWVQVPSENISYADNKYTVLFDGINLTEIYIAGYPYGDMSGYLIMGDGAWTKDWNDLGVTKITIYDDLAIAPGDGLNSGIDYQTVNNDNLIIPGVTFSFKDGKGNANQQNSDTAVTKAEINLTTETLTVTGVSIEAYSIDGGATWKAGGFADKDFIKLLNKGGELWLCYKDYNGSAKKPQGSGNEHNIIAFSKINARPKAPKVAVNYALDADPTGDTPGYWLITAKGGTTALRGSDIQIGKAAGKTIDEKGYGQFYAAPNHGVPVEAFNGTKATKSLYFIRTAPKQEGNTYTPASKPAKVKPSSAIKPPKYKEATKAEKLDKDGKVKTPASAVVKVKANTYVSIGGAPPVLYKEKAEIDMLSVTDAIELWQVATAKKPASAKQVITR